MAQRTVFSWSTLLILLAVGSPAIHAAPLNSKNISPAKALDYLALHRYLEGNTADISAGRISADALNSAIKEFQKFVGLTVTGQLDEATVSKITTPYCGVKDDTQRGNSTSSNSYSVLGTRWNKRHLTYTILNRPHYLQTSTVFNEIARAFNVWSEHVDLTFSPVWDDYEADIKIQFASGEHGDGNPFDGPDHVVGHAYPPPNGEVHFDNSEIWTINSYRGFNLFQVAAHEIGHALGLGHSQYRNALMYDSYPGYQPYFRLHEDDVIGMQALYGPSRRRRG